MNLLTIEHLTKAYTDRVLLDDTSFSIQDGEKIGVIGINGMGKSTLLKIVAGVEVPDEGDVIKGSQVKIGYLPQNPEFHPEDTILQAVLRDIPGGDHDLSVESQAKSLLNKLDMYDFDSKMGHLSGGQKKRVALVNILLQPVDILILDEPTNHLDNAMSEWLEDYLNRYKGAIMMVTHDRYFLDRVSTRIVEVDHGTVYSYPGNYSEYVRLKEARQNMELATERKRQSILRTELEWLARGARARSTKQKAHIQRIEDMKNQKAPEADSSVEMSSIASRMGKKTIEVNGISKKYGDKILFENYSYIFLKGERIGIIGPNGCGKSTMMKMIQGIVPADSGTVDIGQTVKIGYFSQENEYMDESMRVIDYVKEVGDYIHTTDGTITAAQMLERFLFDGTMQWSVIAKLSGGEKRRLYLLRILMSAPNVLVLDEPTNDLDIQTLTILEDYLDSFDGIVITVSHDRYFLDRIVRRIFAFEENGKVVQYEGGYSDYQIAFDRLHPETLQVAETKQKDTKKASWDKGARKLKFTYKEQKEYETIDEDIASLEEKIEAVDEKMVTFASDYGKLNALSQEKEELEHALEEKTERWVYLSELAEKIEAQ